MSAAADLSDLGLSEDVQKLDTQALLELYKKTGDEAVKWAIVLRCEGLIKSVALQIQAIGNITQEAPVRKAVGT